MPNASHIPPDLYALLAETFPDVPIVVNGPTFGGFSNLSLHVTIGERQCVVKAAADPLKRADVAREAMVLAWLADHALPTARLLAQLTNTNWTVEVLRALPGENGLRLFEHTPAALPAAYAALGRTLARVHQLEWPAAGPELQLAERARRIQDAVRELPIEPELQAALTDGLAQLAIAPARPQLVHGDPGIHNILWDGRLTALLDWEWAGVGDPARDLAWLAWTMHFRAVAASCWPAFLTAYQAAGGTASVSGARIRALALGQIAGILVRIWAQPALREEWLRRAQWTLDLSP